MKRKLLWAILALCTIVCVAVATVCFMNHILGIMYPPAMTAAELSTEEGIRSLEESSWEDHSVSGEDDPEEGDSGSGGETTGEEDGETGMETTGEEINEPGVGTSEETGVPGETCYNGDLFEDNGHPYLIKVNRKQNVVTIYTLDDEGFYTVPCKAMVCSVGLNNRTPRGTFKIPSDRYEWHELVGQVYGQYAVRIRRSIMFHSVPYYSASKDDLETEEFNKLGEPASKGCIRLSVIDAKWIYDNCEKGTIVQIFDSDYIGPLGKPSMMKLETGTSADQYDPTDIDEDSPWYHEEPYIFGAEDVELASGCTFDIMSGVSAYDSDGRDITDQLEVTGEVDVKKPGIYTVTYRIMDQRGRKNSVNRKIVVE